MKELASRGAAFIFDAKVLVGIGGVLLSIAAHELFHIIIHWGEIQSVHLFPVTQAIFEIVFTPSSSYNLALEEGVAYGITMVTLILTAMLIADLYDADSEKNVSQILLGNDPTASSRQTFEQLADLLGVTSRIS